MTKVNLELQHAMREFDEAFHETIRGLEPAVVDHENKRNLYDLYDVLPMIQDNPQTPIDFMQRVFHGDLKEEFASGRDYFVLKFLNDRKYMKNEVRMFLTPIGIFRLFMADNKRLRKLNRRIGMAHGFDANGQCVIGKKKQQYKLN